MREKKKKNKNKGCSCKCMLTARTGPSNNWVKQKLILDFVTSTAKGTIVRNYTSLYSYV